MSCFSKFGLILLSKACILHLQTVKGELHAARSQVETLEAANTGLETSLTEAQESVTALEASLKLKVTSCFNFFCLIY